MPLVFGRLCKRFKDQQQHFFPPHPHSPKCLKYILRVTITMNGDILVLLNVSLRLEKYSVIGLVYFDIHESP